MVPLKYLMFGFFLGIVSCRKVCKQTPIELAIVLDSSRSVLSDGFEKSKQFLQEFLNHFDVGGGENEVRVSVITFARGIYPEDAFNLTTYSTHEHVINAIRNIPFRSGDYTATGEGIEYMHRHQLTPEVVRSGVPKVCLVITDGNSQDEDITSRAAAAARADGIMMFALGVGSVEDKELERIAGDKSRTARAENYDSLASVKDLLATKTCVEIATTPLPNTGPGTSCGGPVDVNFVFSPSDLGLDATSWATSFMSWTMAHEEILEGFLYGVVTGSCPEDAGFPVDRYNNTDDIMDHLQRYDRFRLPALAQRVRRNGFQFAPGEEEYTRNVAVLVVNGMKIFKKGGGIRTSIKALVDSEIEVYIANRQGSPISVEGAISLSGTSPIEQAADLVQRLCPT